MPTQRITFTGGVVQAESAPLSAPYALKNAYLEPGGTARALLEGSAASSVPAPGTTRQIMRHAGEWVEVRDAIYRNGLLYAANVTLGSLGVYPPDSDTREDDVARITSVSTSDSIMNAVDANRYILYCLIPVNRRDEAGPWEWVAHKTGDEGDTDGFLPDIDLGVTEETSHVEVYRTAEARAGYVQEHREALGWYSLGRFAASGTDFTITDTQQWSFEGEDTIPDVELRTRMPNAWTVVGSLQRPRGKTLHYANGRLYLGAPRWHTATPNRAYTGGSGRDVQLVFEYETPEGTVFGAGSVAFNAGVVVSIPEPPAVALRVYVRNDAGDWLYYRRLTLEEDGFWSGSIEVFSETLYTPTAAIAQEDPPDSTLTLSEPSTVLISAQNRPLEVTFEQFSLPSGNEVKALFPARLAEEEGVASYDFYVATDEEIYAATPGEDGVRLRVVSNTFGVGEDQFLNPTIAPIEAGVAIVDSHGRVRILSGRRTQELFARGTEPWEEVKDIAYDARRSEIAILTDTGLWGYSVTRGQIVRQYETNGTALTYDTDSDELLVYEGAWKTLDESGAALEASLTTQRLAEAGNDFAVELVEADYDKSGYDAGDPSTWARLRHAIRHDAVAQVDEAATPGTQFALPRGFPVYPRLRGGGHQFKIEQFDTLRDITLRGDATLFEDTD